MSITRPKVVRFSLLFVAIIAVVLGVKLAMKHGYLATASSKWTPSAAFLSSLATPTPLLALPAVPIKTPPSVDDMHPVAPKVTGPITVTVHGGDDASLRNLLETYLVPGFDTQPADQITVTFGAISNAALLNLPVPATFTVLGTIGQKRGPREDIQIILQTTLPAEELAEPLYHWLIEQGFTPKKYGADVFEPAPAPVWLLCNPDRKLDLYLSAFTAHKGVTTIRINIISESAFGSLWYT